MAAGSSPIVTYSKDPNAVLDYTIDWSAWLGDDQILTSTWTVPGGLSQSGVTFSGSTTTIWLSGGIAGTSYSVYNQITTVGGRTEKRTFKVNALDR
jgi:hypothetical protein